MANIWTHVRDYQAAFVSLEEDVKFPLGQESRMRLRQATIWEGRRPLLLPEAAISDVRITIYSCGAFYISCAKGLQKARLSGKILQFGY